MIRRLTYPDSTILSACTDVRNSYAAIDRLFLASPGFLFANVSDFESRSEWEEGLQSVKGNLVTGWTNGTYPTFTSSGALITSAINTGVYTYTRNSGSFDVKKGEVVSVMFDFTLNSGSAPNMYLYDLTDIVSNVVVPSGSNGATFTATKDTTVFIEFSQSDAGNWSTSEVIASRQFNGLYQLDDVIEIVDSSETPVFSPGRVLTSQGRIVHEYRFPYTSEMHKILRSFDGGKYEVFLSDRNGNIRGTTDDGVTIRGYRTRRMDVVKRNLTAQKVVSSLIIEYLDYKEFDDNEVVSNVTWMEDKLIST